MMENRINLLENTLASLYGSALSKEQIRSYAKALYESAFDNVNELDDIIAVITEYESDYDIAGKNSQFYYVFHDVINMLEDGAEVANRLYNCFMYRYEDFSLFTKLMHNAEWLTKEQYNEAMSRAQKIFDTELLEISGFITKK